MNLNSAQRQTHERALAAAITYQKAESEMLEVLQEAEALGIHKCFGLSSLLKYAVQHLRLSEPVALAFIAVSRKSQEVPTLKSAILERRLSVSAANRLVSTLTNDNAAELIRFAETHSWRETEREVAKRNPRAAVPDKVKMLGNGLVQIMLTVSEENYKDFERARSVEAQRKRKSPSRSEAFVATVTTYLDKHDPVRKAQRAQSRSEHSVRSQPKSKKFKARFPLTAAELHAVHLRDQGRCTHVNESGIRCNEDRWTHIHHIRPVSQGGTNKLDNLATLCSFHHDLVHQLSLPLDGQITWLRDKRVFYTA